MRRSAKGFTLIEIMVVIAIIAGLIGTVAIIVPQMQEKSRRLTCQQRLSQLGQIFVAERTEKGGRPKYDGAALWLSYRVGGYKIREGEESSLVCPGDQSIVSPDNPEAQKKYDNIDLSNPPDNMTSFAARDFGVYGLSMDDKKRQIIGCDRNGPNGRTAHHQDGLVICWDSGACSFTSREELGITPGTDIVVGPESSHDDLKKVVNIKTKAKSE